MCNLTHRGAVSADPKAGDGVGILTQIPHQFFQKELANKNVILPRPDDYAVGMFFLPQNLRPQGILALLDPRKFAP